MKEKHVEIQTSSLCISNKRGDRNGEYIFISLSLSIEIFQEKRRNFIDQLYLESVEERLKEKEKKNRNFLTIRHP